MKNMPAPNDSSVLWKVLHLAHTLEGRLEAALGEAGLSLAKFGVLRFLSEAEESLPLGELAALTQCVRSNMTQLVDRLESDGLARRENDPNDRRVRRVSLTAAGREAAERGGEIVRAHEAEAAEALRNEEAALTRALERLVP